MELGKLSGELVKSRLPYPHDLEYEKTFWPFAILTKKRYVGNKYEFDNNKYKQDFMGIVLKRRDNAPIVKEICSGIIDQLINKRSPDGAKKFMVSCLNDMFEGKYDIRYFLQSRTLKMKESYKDWTRIAHVYLADKISKRDPGFTPQSGDRIEYVVIKVDNPENKKLLQGDIIEVPSYVKQNNLEIDYMFYLTNQIMNPALQFLELVDKNAKNLFQEFINKYSIIKVKKTTKKASQQAKTKIKELIKQLNVLRRTKCIVKTLKTNYKNLISIIKKMK
jgi:DNA polymerase elongation subunit (family B)